MSLPLVFDPPGRATPPRHLADLDRDERRAAVVDARTAAVPGRSAVPAVLRPVGERHGGDDRAAGRALRRRLGDALLPPLLTEVRQLSTDAGTTRKSLWRLYDGTLIESVLMRYPDRITVCVSSQAGCGMACPFCATGQGGLRRNLSAGEIVEQVAAAARSRRPW